MSSAAQQTQVPTYAVDPFWPKPLPNQWILGAVAGVAVDASDHVWIVHRPSTLQPNETRSIWRAAPPVLEFDSEGNLISAWGGPAPAAPAATSASASPAGLAAPAAPSSPAAPAAPEYEWP